MLAFNESGVDRVIRIVLGLSLGYIGLTTLTGNSQVVVAAIGSILLVTGLIGFCPLYALFGISTKK